MVLGRCFLAAQDNVQKAALASDEPVPLSRQQRNEKKKNPNPHSSLLTPGWSGSEEGTTTGSSSLSKPDEMMMGGGTGVCMGTRSESESEVDKTVPFVFLVLLTGEQGGLGDEGGPSSLGVLSGPASYLAGVGPAWLESESEEEDKSVPLLQVLLTGESAGLGGGGLCWGGTETGWRWRLTAAGGWDRWRKGWRPLFPPDDPPGQLYPQGPCRPGGQQAPVEPPPASWPGATGLWPPWAQRWRNGCCSTVGSTAFPLSLYLRFKKNVRTTGFSVNLSVNDPQPAADGLHLPAGAGSPVRGGRCDKCEVVQLHQAVGVPVDSLASRRSGSEVLTASRPLSSLHRLVPSSRGPTPARPGCRWCASAVSPTPSAFLANGLFGIPVPGQGLLEGHLCLPVPVQLLDGDPAPGPRLLCLLGILQPRDILLAPLDYGVGETLKLGCGAEAVRPDA
ncbi:hypothetical protein FQN60_009155 [Etheostoma spectabile]|uniref:Uncharacterized protein n=1 Tax=Etheostoma spectabile TaxID=54343 RepID=A0A5J5CNW8_9PERO|nr:hypothetical protein FQN60_009155 [Etheostoma spectabile]